MTMLKYSQVPNNKKKVRSSAKPDKLDIKHDDDLSDLFPLPRYFQIHFAHIHDKTHDIQDQIDHLDNGLQGQLDQLKLSITNVENKLDRFITLFCKHIEP